MDIEFATNQQFTYVIKGSEFFSDNTMSSVLLGGEPLPSSYFFVTGTLQPGHHRLAVNFLAEANGLIRMSGAGGTVDFTIVPEPSMNAMGALGAMIATRRTRRRHET